MLRFDQIVAVERLLTAVGSHRAVSRRTGVSRGAVARIAARCQRAAEPADAAAPTEPAPRCPTCGHRVQPPCRICLVRAWRQTTLAASRRDLETDDHCAVPPLGIELRGEHLARYEALRRKRLRAEGRGEEDLGAEN